MPANAIMSVETLTPSAQSVECAQAQVQLRSARRAALTRLALGAVALPVPAEAGRATAVPRPWPKGLSTPALALPTQDGQTWNLVHARGRVVVLNFWASWCEPCRDEMPSLARLAQREAAAGLLVRAINYRENASTIAEFLTKTPDTPTVLRDTDGEAARAWQVRIFPTTVVIGRDGRAAFSVVGEVDWAGEAAQQWLAPWLANRGAASAASLSVPPTRRGDST